MSFYEMCFNFLLYSVLGFFVEVAYQAARNHMVINRGFLNGPVCPVYGFGVVGIFTIIHLAERYLPGAAREEGLPLPLLFLLGIALATTLELSGGLILDKLFHARWWDYTDMRFNFRGYICPRFSLIWGFLIVCVVKILQPFFSTRVRTWISPRALFGVMVISYLLYFIDLVVSICVVLKLNRELAELDQIRSSMRLLSNSLTMVVGEGAFLAQDVVSEGKQRAEALLPGREEKKEKIEQEQPLISQEENILETRADYEKKKEEVLLVYRENVRETKQAVGEKTEAIKAKAHLALEKAQGAKEMAQEAAVGKAQEAMGKAQEAKEKAQEALALLSQQKDAWYARFRRGSHYTLRRVMRAYPHFRHLLYDESLQEIKKEIEEEEKREVQGKRAGR